MNLRPSGPKPDALPGCATLRYLLMPVVKILTGLSNLQNLSSASNLVSSFFTVLLVPSNSLGTVLQLARNMHSIMIEV